MNRRIFQHVVRVSVGVHKQRHGGATTKGDGSVEPKGGRGLKHLPVPTQDQVLHSCNPENAFKREASLFVFHRCESTLRPRGKVTCLGLSQLVNRRPKNRTPVCPNLSLRMVAPHSQAGLPPLLKKYSLASNRRLGHLFLNMYTVNYYAIGYNSVG